MPTPTKLLYQLNSVAGTSEAVTRYPQKRTFVLKSCLLRVRWDLWSRVNTFPNNITNAVLPETDTRFKIFFNGYENMVIALAQYFRKRTLVLKSCLLRTETWIWVWVITLSTYLSWLSSHTVLQKTNARLEIVFILWNYMILALANHTSHETRYFWERMFVF